MNKNKIVMNYLDFINGKLLPKKHMDVFKDRYDKFLKYFQSGEFEINDVRMHPSHVRNITQYLAKTKRQMSKDIPHDLAKDFDDISMCSLQIQYLQAIEKKIDSNSIYVISNKIFDYFSSIELPENITFEDIRFHRDIPSLFVFENGVIGFLNYYTKRVNTDTAENDTELLMLLFNGMTSYPFIPMDIFINSLNNEEKNKRFIEEQLKAIEAIKNESSVRDLGKYTKFIFNILLFLSTKDSVSFQKQEFNLSSEIAKKNYLQNKNKNNLRKWKEIPSYNFVDLEITMNHYSVKYYEGHKEQETEGTPKRPHWRSAHWHTYWKGKRGEAQEKVLKFIPATWVGDLELQKNQTTLKVFKVKKPV